MGPRDAPTTFNSGMWDQSHVFGYGRVESLGKTPGKNGGDGYGIRTPDSAFCEHDPRALARIWSKRRADFQLHQMWRCWVSILELKLAG